MILLTGGTGYIGSHIAVELLDAGHQVVILDNLSNSVCTVVDRIKTISQKEVEFYKGDVRDAALLGVIFKAHNIKAVIHCAGLKAVGESVSNPLAYYDANVYGSISLCKAMEQAGVKRLIFSSSATVYGHEAEPPYMETMARGSASSPYGASKAMIEKVLEDLSSSDPQWSFSILRYFNPIGAHPSGYIGESPQGIPNNLMPYISQVAAGVLPELLIYGNDYPTDDGTCVRDYLHVVDLAVGHRMALQTLEQPGVHYYNLGAGKGVSVQEMVDAFILATGVDVPYRFAPRRKGDLAAFWASSEKAERELGWRTRKSLVDMMVDTWRWQQFTSSENS
ncbi:UDP-glucose 4-epimerase GalE [Vreelandella olivaria]|uniref:UDP-glucose 4-epimerase GalE n=1 Tax=Vreelandella olivaria TaxID=390919 RepID=UPI00201E8AC4|nr:UDP-glucose 4-epimerase GalE [Halomonas olivaria]